MRGVRWIRMASLALVLAGLGAMASALWVPAKAELAQVLLQRAWRVSQESGAAQRPWMWADHTTVAQLQVPSHGVDQIVLAGDSGAVLAFAPGENMQARQADGAHIISGHRDTHFRFLEYVRPGTEILLKTLEGERRFQVTHTQVANARTTKLDPHGLQGGLVLVTCYPFDALQAGGDERYLVFAKPADTT